MTAKTKMSNLEAYQELSIQITCLDMKLNKILELLNKPEEGTYDLSNIVLDYKHKCSKITPACFSGPCDCTIRPDLSDNENFEDTYK